MCWEREAEEKALRTYLNEQDAEEWDRQRIEQGLPHPCEDCDRHCSGSCRFYGVRGTYKPSFNSNLHPFIAEIFKQHFGI
jgi:hypothetical protein